MLSDTEVQALDAILERAIVKSQEEDDGDPVFHDVGIDGLNLAGDKRTQPDVYSSLAAKGLIECSGSEDASGNEILEYVCITSKGLEALKTARGVN